MAQRYYPDGTAITLNSSMVGLANGIKEAKKAVDNFSEAIKATTKTQRKGVSKPIICVGHKYPKRNPALNAWKAGVACHRDWKPTPIEQLPLPKIPLETLKAAFAQ